MNRTWLKRIPVLAGVLMFLALPAVVYAEFGYVSPLDELPLTSPQPVGARAAGMGFVSMAVADDATAITSNPAALARLNRVELSGGFRRSALSVEGERAGYGFGSELSGTDFTSIRFAYPFPTFRGSLVFGLSAEKLYDFSDDRLAAYEAGFGPPGSVEIMHNEEDYLSNGGITAFSGACAVDVSPAISLGVTLSYLAGEYSLGFEHAVAPTDDVESPVYVDTRRSDADAGGFRATVGGLFYVSEQLSVGVAVDSRTSLTLDGSVAMREQISGAVSDSTVVFHDEIQLPFAFRGGVAYVPLDFLLVGVDLSYTDWSEIDYAGRITAKVDDGEEQRRRSFYDEKLGYGIGAELTVPSWPVRFRGGYASRPIAYNGLEVVTDRSYLTLGMGVLIDTVLAIDVAWVKGSYERADYDYDFVESVEDNALILEATYRF